MNEENEVARVCEALDREERDLSQAIVVIDCDAFYASVVSSVLYPHSAICPLRVIERSAFAIQRRSWMIPL